MLLERSQKIQQILLILWLRPEKSPHNSICLRARTPVFSDCLHQIFGAAVVEKEQPLSKSPHLSHRALASSAMALAMISARPAVALSPAISDGSSHIASDSSSLSIGSPALHRARKGRKAQGMPNRP